MQVEIDTPSHEFVHAPSPGWTLCLRLDPEDLAPLLRQPELRPGRTRPRAERLSLVWHDTPDGRLAGDRLALAVRHDAGSAAVWQLTRLVPDTTDIWPPGGAAPLLEESPTQMGVTHPLVASQVALLLPLAAFEGTRRTLVDTPALRAELLEGTLRAVTATRPVCRLALSGPAAAATALALATRVRLGVAAEGLAAEALHLARPASRVTRPLGAPALPPDFDVDAGFAFVTAHLAGVLMHHVPGALAQAGPEPVHQMRVAVRRLRSAILLFRRAVSCPELDDVTAGLKALGQVLGPPRDWDVFLLGTGARVAASFPDDAAVQSLIAAAERRRQAGYAALDRHLGSAAFRGLGIALASLAMTRPWRVAVPDDAEAAARRAQLQHAALADYAARALSRRLAPVIAPGDDLSGLAPEALHEIRLHAKRLRYAAEFFAPLFPGRETRRFLRRMAAVQERLGLLNDSTVAAALMADLPPGGPARAHATGVVRGFVAARTAGGQRKMLRSWQRFRKLEPFWT